MPCFDNYIEIDRSTVSRSGLYGSDLPGVEIPMLEGLTKEDQDDYEEFWNMIVGNAWNNMVSDISLALQNKFIVDSKIVSRVTSKFKEEANITTGLAGIKLEFVLPRYARIHINSIEVFSHQEYESPDAIIRIYDTDEDGELLYEGGHELSEGRNTIKINRDFEVDNLFISYDPEVLEFRQTENKYYMNSIYNKWDVMECIYPCSGIYGEYTGKVTQHNGGGLNVIYSVVCSIDKFICENINLFKMAFWYRIGVELMDEALLGNRLNRFTTMTAERATERSGYFGAKYTSNITEAVKSHNIQEDPICFKCKNITAVKNILP
jgi:hypothetical protein